MPPQSWAIIIIMAMGCICPVPLLGNCKCHQGGRVLGTTHQIAEDRFSSFEQLWRRIEELILHIGQVYCLKIDGLVGGWVPVGRSDGGYEGMQRLGGARYGGQDYLRPSVGAFLTHLNMSVSVYVVQCTFIALSTSRHVACILQIMGGVAVLFSWWEHSVKSVDKYTDHMGGYEGQGAI